MSPREIIILLLVLGGIFFAVVAVVGLIRLPDLYTRTHSTSKSETLGAVLALAAVAIAFEGRLSILKTVLLLVFMFLTSPTAAHAIARAAAEEGVEAWTTDTEGDDS
jgi:multicomponent Na+:H+ antiporter subunit G